MTSHRSPDADHPDLRDIGVKQILEALVDPVRRSVVCRLYETGAALSCGAFDLPVTKATATHHFRVLREAGLIHQAYVGTSRMNTLRRDELETAFPGLVAAVVAAERRSVGVDAAISAT